MTEQDKFKIKMDILNENDLGVSSLYLGQFDGLSETELLSKDKMDEIIRRIKEYDSYVESDNMQYPENIMRDVRRNLGLHEFDTSKDSEIFQMPHSEILNRVCNWNNLINYGTTISNWIEQIYGIRLED